MKTSQQWWDEVKSDEMKTKAWLRRQWRGEVTASFRIQRLAKQFTDEESQEHKILNAIAHQEEQHASWIKELLDARGIEVDGTDIASAENRYWAETLPGIKDFTTGTAVAAHAEGMRLDRIRVIANDKQAPEDIRDAFTKILKDEVWHEAAFTKLSTPEAMEETRHNHRAGLEALGLTA
jgi:rubrerythrin